MKLDLISILPPGSQDPEQFRWQRAITTAVLLSLGANVALAGQAYRAQSATGSTIELVLERLDQAESETVAVRLLMLRARYCAAVAQVRAADSEEWGRQIVALKAHYSALTFGRPFPEFEPCP